MAQVFDNIIINARQAMPNGGQIVISARNIYASSGRQVQISFEDNGIGIAPHLLAQIFDPFFSTKKSGHGLGLAIVYSIIRKHDGDIIVESIQNKGTKFLLSFPV
ncbi:MAG: hypothetical protein HQK50_19320, partial [Oligoflexia bacterium]|nr:hypothetical protein [Oligoflexia bacterium]